MPGPFSSENQIKHPRQRVRWKRLMNIYLLLHWLFRCTSARRSFCCLLLPPIWQPAAATLGGGQIHLTACSRSHKAVYARPGCDGDDASLQQPGRNIGGTLLPSPSRNQYLNFALTNEVVLFQGVAHIGATSMYVTLQ